jgi:transcriptional regulator with XRE-family HTH domain
MMDNDERRAHKQELAKLGRAFREARERSGLSEREVADAVRGISLDGIRKIEAGERPSFNYEQIIHLSHALGVEPSTIFVRAESLHAECPQLADRLCE